jgi:hypothetical protein
MSASEAPEAPRGAGPQCVGADAGPDELVVGVFCALLAWLCLDARREGPGKAQLGDLLVALGAAAGAAGALWALLRPGSLGAARALWELAPPFAALGRALAQRVQGLEVFSQSK